MAAAARVSVDLDELQAISRDLHELGRSMGIDGNRREVFMREELTELAEALERNRKAPSPFPCIEPARRFVARVLNQALVHPSCVEVADIDAILTAATKTADQRRDRGLGDPFAEDRARCVQIWTRYRRELLQRRRLGRL